MKMTWSLSALAQAESATEIITPLTRFVCLFGAVLLRCRVRLWRGGGSFLSEFLSNRKRDGGDRRKLFSPRQPVCLCEGLRHPDKQQKTVKKWDPACFHHQKLWIYLLLRVCGSLLLIIQKTTQVIYSSGTCWCRREPPRCCSRSAERSCSRCRPACNAPELHRQRHDAAETWHWTVTTPETFGRKYEESDILFKLSSRWERRQNGIHLQELLV